MSTKQFEITRIFSGTKFYHRKKYFHKSSTIETLCVVLQALIHANLSTLRGPQYKVIQARWTLRGNSLHDEKISGQEELSDE